MNTPGQHSPGSPRPPGPEDPIGGANPLRRPCDRVQSWLNRLLVLLLLLGAPVAALAVGGTVHTSEMHAVRAESVQRHEVTARLTADAHGAMLGGTGEDAQRAPVRWTEKDGTVHTGTALVAPGRQAGTTVRTWVDRNGAVTTAPAEPMTATVTGWAAGGLAAVAVVGVGLAAREGLGWMIDRHRYAQWDREWELLEPQWTGRLR